MAHWTRRYAVPSFVAALTVFVLVATAFVLTVTRQTPSSADPDPTAGPDPTTDCLVGTWRATMYWQMDPALGITKLHLRSGGYEYEYRPDGSGRVAFHDGVTLTGDLLGTTIDLVLAGDVEFRYTVEDGMIQVTDQWSNVTATMLGVPSDEVITLQTEPFAYDCDGDRLGQSLDGTFAGEFVRLS